MTGLFIVLGLIAIGSVILPWVNMFRINGLRDEIAHLRSQINASAYLKSERDSATLDIPEPVEVQMREAEEAPISTFEPALPSPPYSEPVEHPVRTSAFEFNLGTKLPVWLGALSLIFAAFFLIKYSIEAQLIGPGLRVMIGLAFGSGLVAGGVAVFRKIGLPNHERIAQGLIGAGLATLYVCLYAAVHLYHLIPDLMGFGGMVAVTGMAVVLSLRHGQPVAAFGLLGGLLTPALVGSASPDAMPLFTYLFLLSGLMLAVLARNGWWGLAALTLGGLYLWTGYWVMYLFVPDDAFILNLFVMAVCGTVLAFTHSRNKEDETGSPDLLNMMAIVGAAATVCVLGQKAVMTGFDWSMMELLGLACVALAWFRPQVYRIVLYMKLGLDLLMLGWWMDYATLAQVWPVIAGMVAVYVAVPQYLMHRTSDPRLWAAVQCIAAVGLFGLGYMMLPLQDSGYWGVAALTLAAACIWQMRELRMRYSADGDICDQSVGIFALAATGFISSGLAIELPEAQLPLAFAVQALATSWIAQKVRVNCLSRMAVLLSLTVVVLNWDLLMPMADYMFASLFMDKTTHILPAATWLQLGMPGLLLLGAVALDRSGERWNRLTSACGVTLVAAFSYQLVRSLFHPAADILTVQAGFIERGFVTALAAGIGVAMIAATRKDTLQALKPWGIALCHIAMARIIWFDLMALNPYFEQGQSVGDAPLLNGITLTYGTGMALSLYAVCSRRWHAFAGTKSFYKLAGFGLLFTFVSLTVRQLFHGADLEGSMAGNGEFYSYSIAWLLTALGLLAYGIMYGSKTARVASLGFMLITVAKVFLLDAGQLEGLYRVASFLGLGLSLIGLSVFYTRYIFRQEEGQTEKAGPWWF